MKIKTGKKDEEKNFCVECVREGIALLLTKKKSEEPEVKSDASNDAKKRKIVYDQTLDVDAE